MLKFVFNQAFEAYYFMFQGQIKRGNNSQRIKEISKLKLWAKFELQIANLKF